MKAVLQRVSQGSVSVGGDLVAAIGPGLVILLGVAPEDSPDTASRLAEKIAQLRIFQDENGKMNLSLLDIGGQALVVPQFTLFADSSRGHRPSFTKAAPPETARPLANIFTACLRDLGVSAQEGIFGAHMVVEIVNDGPVTILVEV